MNHSKSAYYGTSLLSAQETYLQILMYQDLREICINFDVVEPFYAIKVAKYWYIKISKVGFYRKVVSPHRHSRRTHEIL